MRLALTVLLLALLQAACAAPPADETTSAPPQASTTPASGEVDFSCSVDADCAVKDVGNCCGYYPACVNRDSPTFPEQVKARCEREGISSICGFPVIEDCRCVEGRCAAAPSGESLD